MSHKMAVSQQYTLASRTSKLVATVEGDNLSSSEIEKAAAKTGSLTTRTDANTGELTMAGGHGIVDGQRVDLYWEVGGVAGHRRGMTVGTVAANQVPIDGGAGDDLPADETPNIRVSVPQEEVMVIAGNNVQGIQVSCTKRSIIVFADASEGELASALVEAGSSYNWFTGNGVTNPLAGDALASVYMSNMDPSAAGTILTQILHN